MSSQILTELYFFGGIAIAFIALIGLPYGLYLSAGRAIKASKREIADYKKQLYEIRRKRNQIRNIATFSWPIWPRPHLFEEIDQSTQLALAHLEQNASIIEEIVPTIQPIDPLPYKITTIFDVSGNGRRLWFHYQNKRRLGKFLQHYQVVIEAAELINENRKKVKALKRQVEQKIGRLGVEFSKASNNLSYFQNLGIVRFQDASANIQVAQVCIEKAEKELAKPSQIQGDKVEWAAADLLCQAGGVSLEIFKLKGQSYSYSEKYEADEVLQRLADLTNELDSALTYIDIHSWTELVRLRNRMKDFRIKLEETSSLLSEFEALVQEFQRLTDQLKIINIDILSREALRTEEGLQEYVGSPSEAPEIWLERLGVQGVPSQRLVEAKTEFEQKIQPIIQSIIQQSKLPNNLSSIHLFLDVIQDIRENIIRLEELREFHKKCEEEVKHRLSENGPTTISISKLDGFSHNSTREIIRACQVKIKLYQKYRDRAHGVRKKANFPMLLEEAKRLEGECRKLIEAHEIEVEKLQVQAQGYHRKLTELYNDLVDLRHKRPVIEWDWDTLFFKFAESAQEYERTGSNYQTLLNFTHYAKDLIEEATLIYRKFEKQHENFENLYQRTTKQFLSSDKSIRTAIDKFQMNWNTPLSKHVLKLTEFQRQYSKWSLELQTAQRELSMDSAITVCEQIKQKADQLDKRMQEEVRRASEHMRHLDRILKDAENLIRSRKVDLPHAVEQARKDISEAREAADPQKAIFYLNRAKNGLEQAYLYASPNIQYTDNRKVISLFGERIGTKVERISHVSGRVNVAGRDIHQSKRQNAKGKRK